MDSVERKVGEMNDADDIDIDDNRCICLEERINSATKHCKEIAIIKNSLLRQYRIVLVLIRLR